MTSTRRATSFSGLKQAPQAPVRLRPGESRANDPATDSDGSGTPELRRSSSNVHETKRSSESRQDGSQSSASRLRLNLPSALNVLSAGRRRAATPRLEGRGASDDSLRASDSDGERSSGGSLQSPMTAFSASHSPSPSPRAVVENTRSCLDAVLAHPGQCERLRIIMRKGRTEENLNFLLGWRAMRVANANTALTPEQRIAAFEPYFAMYILPDAPCRVNVDAQGIMAPLLAAWDARATGGLDAVLDFLHPVGAEVEQLVLNMKVLDALRRDLEADPLPEPVAPRASGKGLSAMMGRLMRSRSFRDKPEKESKEAPASGVASPAGSPRERDLSLSGLQRSSSNAGSVTRGGSSTSGGSSSSGSSLVFGSVPGLGTAGMSFLTPDQMESVRAAFVRECGRFCEEEDDALAAEVLVKTIAPVLVDPPFIIPSRAMALVESFETAWARWQSGRDEKTLEEIRDLVVKISRQLVRT